MPFEWLSHEKQQNKKRFAVCKPLGALGKTESPPDLPAQSPPGLQLLW
jgi:hypothetical protein